MRNSRLVSRIRDIPVVTSYLILAGIITACITGCLSSTSDSPIPDDPSSTQSSSQLTATCKILDFGSQLPEFDISLINNTSNPIQAGSLIIVAYESGTETGSTTVDINQVITADQDMVFWSDLPEQWYTDTSYPPSSGKPDSYFAIPSTCNVL